MRIRRFLKGDTRRLWRNHGAQAGTMLLAAVIVLTLIWTMG
ncbi:MAG TPA: hypothetical protein VD995_24265 [Azospirillum sp.]|nr:hypothetical protein [Azospirillum sp.]